MKRSGDCEAEIVGGNVGVGVEECDDLGLDALRFDIAEQFRQRNNRIAHLVRYYSGIKDRIDVNHSSLQIRRQANKAPSTTSAVRTASTVERSIEIGSGMANLPRLPSSPKEGERMLWLQALRALQPLVVDL